MSQSKRKRRILGALEIAFWIVLVGILVAVFLAGRSDGHVENKLMEHHIAGGQAAQTGLQVYASDQVIARVRKVYGRWNPDFLVEVEVRIRQTGLLQELQEDLGSTEIGCSPFQDSVLDIEIMFCHGIGWDNDRGAQGPGS